MSNASLVYDQLENELVCHHSELVNNGLELSKPYLNGQEEVLDFLTVMNSLRRQVSFEDVLDGDLVRGSLVGASEIEREEVLHLYADWAYLSPKFRNHYYPEEERYEKLEAPLTEVH